ncbi:NAD(P)-dependent alcohol dehydrogenase [Streptomyces sp. NPDC005799]|uniref:NAD(P)-dependent alcohol dehydrogenase n=1 Tax=Streptomyces sp. NPDC005799 TaxID=3154678 RepID=UPI0033E4F0C2
MSVTTKAALAVPGQDAYRIADITVGEPQDHEVLVRVVTAGLCHTDALFKGAWQDPSLPPIVLGHEGAGVVQKVGALVTSVKPGDRVLMTFNSCGECDPCRTGHPAYCARFSDLNTSPTGSARTDGTSGLTTTDGKPLAGGFFGQSSLAGYAIANDRNVVAVDADEDELALLAPLGCGIQTGAGAILNELKPEPGSTVAVFGTGAVGMASVLAAGLTGASKIVAVDIVDSRLKLARELGATHTVNSATTDPVAALREISGGPGVQVAVETSGVPQVQVQAVDALATRGRLGLIGVRLDGHFDVLGTSLLRGITVHGVIEGDSDIVTFLPALVDYVRQGRFPLQRLIQEYPLKQIDQAAADSKSGKTIKPVIRF